MPANFVNLFLTPFFRPQKRASRLGNSSRHVCSAEYLEDRRMLSVNVNTVTPELQFDLNQQSLPASFDKGAELDGVVYFSGTSFERRGEEAIIWSYDPAANDGVGEVRPLELTGDTHDLTFVRNIDGFDGSLYVRAYNGLGYYLFSIDLATSVVTKIATFSSSKESDHFSYGEMVFHNGDLFYRDDDPSGGMGLWRYTPGIGTTEVANFQIGVGDTAHEMLLIADRIYLNVIGSNGNFQIWEYDPAIEGTEATSLVFETTVANNDSPEMATVNGKIYFTVEDNLALWEVDLQVDPTPVGAELVYLPDVSNSTSTDIFDLVAMKGKLYWTSSRRGLVSFWEYDPESGEDPHNLGYDILPGRSPSVINISAGEDYLYLFTSLRQNHSTGGVLHNVPGEALLRYDPSQPLADSTTFITDIDLGTGKWSRAEVFEVGASIFFPGQTDRLRYETLLQYDAGDHGEPGQLTEVRQTVELSESSNPHELTVIGDTLFFTATDGIHGYELWQAKIQANGSVTNPEMIADLYAGVIGSNPQNLEVIDGVLYFDAEDHGINSLWRYNPVSEVLTQLDLTSPYTDVITIDNRRYYLWFGSHELYLNYYVASTPLTDGEIIEVPDFHIERIRGLPHHTTAIGENIYFTIKNAITGSEAIYVYDTSVIDGLGAPKRIELPSGVTSPKRFTGFNGKVYFQALTDNVIGELFEYDPSDDSIRQITDFDSSSSYSFPSRMTVFNGQLYFRARANSSPFQLWSFDPAANHGLGQVQLALELEEYSWIPSSLVDEGSPFLIHDGRMYLEAIRSIRLGFEMLVIEPSADGRLLTFAESIKYPSASYFDYEYLVVGNHIISNMFAEIEGRELYSMPLISGELNAEFRYAADPNQIVGTVEIIPSEVTPTFSEWDSPIGQIWLTVGPNASDQVFELNVELQWDTQWFLGPEVVSHLGSDATVVNQNQTGTRTSNVTISVIDLSSYEVGDRVLVATVQFALDPNNSTNLPADTVGTYPLPVPLQGAALVGAKNGTTRQPLLFDDAQSDFQLTPVSYDANDDDRVGIVDFAKFIHHYGNIADESTPEVYRFDFNRDGKVGLTDLALFISQYGKRKFPLVAAASRQLVGFKSESTSRSVASSTGYHLEGESDPSIYLGAITLQPNESEIDNFISMESKYELELIAAIELPTDPSWDAQVIDAAMHSDEVLFTAPSEEIADLDLTMSAELEPSDTF